MTKRVASLTLHLELPRSCVTSLCIASRSSSEVCISARCWEPSQTRSRRLCCLTRPRRGPQPISAVPISLRLNQIRYGSTRTILWSWTGLRVTFRWSIYFVPRSAHISSIRSVRWSNRVAKFISEPCSASLITRIPMSVTLIKNNVSFLPIPNDKILTHSSQLPHMYKRSSLVNESKSCGRRCLRIIIVRTLQ